jgi:hypothetical protein
MPGKLVTKAQHSYKAAVNIKYTLSILLLLGLLLLAISAVGCSHNKIGDILDNPSQYEGKELTVSGTIGETIWFALLGKGAYQIGDGTGNIWIITSQPPLQEGQTVKVTGIVQPAITLGGKSFGTVILEIKRK